MTPVAKIFGFGGGGDSRAGEESLRRQEQAIARQEAEARAERAKEQAKSAAKLQAGRGANIWSFFLQPGSWRDTAGDAAGRRDTLG